MYSADLAILKHHLDAVRMKAAFSQYFVDFAFCQLSGTLVAFKHDMHMLTNFYIRSVFSVYDDTSQPVSNNTNIDFSFSQVAFLALASAGFLLLCSETNNPKSAKAVPAAA